MCELWQGQQDLSVRMNEAVPLHPRDTAWYHYLLLMLVTKTDFDRGVRYLKDTGSAEAATGRLLLRAAERALRESGDTEEDEEEDHD